MQPLARSRNRGNDPTWSTAVNNQIELVFLFCAQEALRSQTHQNSEQ
jgi:hypothetical protein